MKLILYNNFSENNKVDKNINKIIELEGTLREASSLINPSILIELKPNNINGLVVDDNNDFVTYNGIRITWSTFIYKYALSANYVYIPEFNRYYFINDIISIRTNMWRLNMHVDVLMSYKNQIKQMEAFVNRNEFEYNNFIKDDMISYLYSKQVNEYVPTKGVRVNKTFSSQQPLINNNITITVINEDIQLNIDAITPPDESLPIVYAPATGDSMTSITYATFPASITSLSRRLQEDDTLSGFIISLMVFPFTIETNQGHALHLLKLGDTELDETGTSENPKHDDVYVADLETQTSRYYVIADFTIDSESFLDYEPYSQYEIYLPYIGWISMSADNILGNRIIVYYVVNYVTGLSQVTIFDTTYDKILYTGGCQLGVKIGINTTTQREVNDNRTSNGISLGVGLLTSAVSIIAGSVTANPLAIAGGAITAGSTVAKFVQNENTNYLRASGSVNSGQAGLYLPQEVRIRKTSMIPKNYDENYNKLFGKPLNKYMKIEDLTGYTILGEIHIEDIGSITSNEFDELYAILTTGFII